MDERIVKTRFIYNNRIKLIIRISYVDFSHRLSFVFVLYSYILPVAEMGRKKKKET